MKPAYMRLSHIVINIQPVMANIDAMNVEVKEAGVKLVARVGINGPPTNLSALLPRRSVSNELGTKFAEKID